MKKPSAGNRRFLKHMPIRKAVIFHNNITNIINICQIVVRVHKHISKRKRFMYIKLYKLLLKKHYYLFFNNNFKTLYLHILTAYLDYNNSEEVLSCM